MWMFGFSLIFHHAVCDGEGTLQPVVNCSPFVDEGANLKCVCQPPKPTLQAKITWPGYSQTSTLRIDNVSRLDTGRNFTCQMQWSGGISDVPYTLNVAYGRSEDLAILGPSTFITDGSRSITLTCKANDFNPAPLLSWNNISCENGNNDSTCVFTPKPPWDNSRAVGCRAVNPASHSFTAAVASFTLHLSYPPTSPPVISSNSTSFYYRSGDTLTCTVTGGKPRVTRVNFTCSSPDHPDGPDTISGASVTSVLTVDTSRAVAVDTHCTCSAVWEPEPGLYTSIEHKIFFLEYRATILSFTVNGKGAETSVGEADSAVFECKAIGRPAPNLTLQKYGTDDPVKIVPGSPALTHTIGNVDCRDEGIYTCIVANGFPSTDTRSVRLNCYNSSSGGENGLSHGVIVWSGIGASVFVGTVIATVMTVYICRRRNRRYEKPPQRLEDENTYTGLQAAPQPPQLLEPRHDAHSDEPAQSAASTAEDEKDSDRESNFYEEIPALAEETREQKRPIRPRRKIDTEYIEMLG